MEFIVKKTTELSNEEIHQIKNLFETIFERPRSEQEFLNQSLNNPLGYSYHSLMMDDGKIVGFNSFVPSYFLVNGEKKLFANSTDSMVSKPYRDFFNFNDMVTAGFKRMKQDGVVYVFGYPNDNSYPVLIKSKLYKEIGKMHTFCLPIHVGGVKKSMKFLDPLSELFCRAFVSVSGIFASHKSEKYSISKECESYNTTRYKRGDGVYCTETIDGITFHYKIKVHEGVRSAFLIDLSEKSPKAFNLAVKHILRNHRKEFDILIYPGYLGFKNTSMIKMPRKLEPKNFNFVGRALDKKAFDNSIWDIRNWDTNLSNYDLI